MITVPMPNDIENLEAKLPPAAVTKMHRIRQDAIDADVLANVAHGDVDPAERAVAELEYRAKEQWDLAEVEIQKLKDDAEHGERSGVVGELLKGLRPSTSGVKRKPSHDEQSRFAAELERLRAERDRRWHLFADRKERSEGGRLLWKEIVRFVRGLPDDQVADVAPPANPALLAGDGSDAQKVAKLRDRLAELRADAHAARSAPIASAEAKRIATQQIETIAEAGAPDVARVIEAGDLIAWPMTRETAHVKSTTDAFGVLAWLHRDALIAAVCREIDELANDAGALSSEQRAAKLSAIADEVTEIERAEEALIIRSMAEGAEIARRSDADPRAVLGIA